MEAYYRRGQEVQEGQTYMGSIVRNVDIVKIGLEEGYEKAKATLLEVLGGELDEDAEELLARIYNMNYDNILTELITDYRRQIALLKKELQKNC